MAIPKWKWSYFLNPLGKIVDLINDKRGVSEEAAAYKRAHNGSLEGYQTNFDQLKDKWNQFSNWVGERWNDITGQSQIDKQFEQNKELAKFQTDMQEELYNKYSSPESMMKQYAAAGLNPNLMYSGAGSGQGNVPSYTAPHAPLNLSYTDKFNKAIQMMTTALQAKNLVYSTVANREAAEQSYLKTLRLNEALKNDRRNNLIQGLIQGYTGGGQLFGKRYARKGEVLVNGDTAYSLYADAARSKYFNDALRSLWNNAYTYGQYADLGANLQKYQLGDKWSPAAFWDVKNKEYAAQLREFDLGWNQEYKTMLKGAGVAAPIIQTLLRILGGK